MKYHFYAREPQFFRMELETFEAQDDKEAFDKLRAALNLSVLKHMPPAGYTEAVETRWFISILMGQIIGFMVRD